MTISIIGGAGFVGTRLSNYLTKNDIKHRIYDIDIMLFKFYLRSLYFAK